MVVTMVSQGTQKNAAAAVCELRARGARPHKKIEKTKKRNVGSFGVYSGTIFSFDDRANIPQGCHGHGRLPSCLNSKKKTRAARLTITGRRRAKAKRPPSVARD